MLTKTSNPAGPGRTVKQARSRKTYTALLASGFKLLENREFESIKINDIAAEAGYSVGAFYARFESKDEFFEAMVAQHLEERSRARQQLLATTPRDELVEVVIENMVKYYWRRRRFWRAALMRSVHDPDFWKPINHSAQEFVALLTARIQDDVGRELKKVESENIRFASQMVLGMINNRIVNRPRPSLIGQSKFVQNLIRAFRLVSDYDDLVGADPAGPADPR